MRFTINKNEFLKGLLIASRAIGSKSVNPTLLGFKLEMNNEGLEITASNDDIAIWTLVPAIKGEKEIIRNFSFGTSLINAHLLTEVVRKMEGDEISLEVIDDRVAKIDDGNTNFQLNCQTADEYPDIDLEKGENTFSVSCQDLTKLVETTAFAALDKNTRPILTAINLKGEGGKLIATATDSARLSKKSVEIDESIRFSANVPAKTLLEVTRLFEGTPTVEIAASGNKIIFSFGNTVVKSRLIAGDYPVSNSIIPSNFNYRLSVRANELLNAIDRVSILVTDRAAVVKLAMSSEGVEVTSSSDQFGSGAETISNVQYQGERLEVAFNALFVTQAVKALCSDDVELKFIGEMKPFVVVNPNDDTTVELITPMRTR